MRQWRIRSWERAALAGLVLALAAVLGLTAFGGHSGGAANTHSASPVNPYEQARRNGLHELLDRWADAVRSGDEDALPALFDPRAHPGFLDAEVRRSRNLAGVPLSDWGYEIAGGPETPVPLGLADEIGASDVWAPSVYLRYGIEGVDAEPTRRPVALLVARRGDEWKLVSDLDQPELERRTWRGPWDFGPVIVREVSTGDGETSVVMGHPEQHVLVDHLAAELETAVPHVTEVWGGDWSRRALVIVAAARDEFTALVGSAHNGADIAAVTVSDAVDPRSRRVTGQRVVFSPAAADRLTDTTRRSVLRHELAHVAARAATTDGSPMWMLEGFADYVGHRGSDSEFVALAPTLAAAGEPPTTLPDAADFSAGGDRSRIAYESAWSAAAFLAAEFGEDKLVQLYRRLATGPLDSSMLDERVREVLGVGVDELITRWAHWIAGRAD